MKTILVLTAIMAVSAPALAQQRYTCRDVRAQSCSTLRGYAASMPRAQVEAIARRCGVTHCLAQ